MRNRIAKQVLMTACGLVSLQAGAGGVTGAEAGRPNFVFILLDDAGWGDFGCYGNAYTRTPEIDRMAAEGTLFTHAYVNAPVCSPSRVGFLTGIFPGRLGVHHVNFGDPACGMADAVPPDTVWLMQVLQREGYRTGFFGKWHLAHAQRGPNPSDYGIDDHRTSVSPGPGWDRKTNEFIAIEDQLVVDEGLRFIEENKDRPFYLNLMLKRPHTPIAPSEEQMNIGSYKEWSAKGFGRDPIPFTTPHRQYCATITEADRLVGVVRARLAELGLDKNTIVLLSSDNGPEYLNVRFNASVGSSGPFRGGKRSLYEGGIRVPYIVVWPGKIPAGKVNTSTVISGTDWFPTVCALAGTTLPVVALDGEDMSDVFLGSTRERQKPLMWEFRMQQGGYQAINNSPMLAIRDGKWKLLINPDRSRVELYDIINGPMEVDNLASEHPDVVERLAVPLMEFHRSLPEGPIHPQAGKNSYPWPRRGK
jgi:N-acetylgalactosamine-6-sulfatase